MDFYAVLGVEVTASHPEIVKAFRTKSLLLHPDKNAEEASAEQFQILQSAYETLKDAQKRLHYDAGRLLQPIWQRLGIPEAMNDVVIARVAEGLREPEGRVEEVVMQEEIVSQLRNGALRSMEAQSGASLLPFDTDIPGQSVILVSGTPRSVDDGKNQLNFFRNHVLGLSAPAGGLIFIVPSDLICRMPIMEQNFRTLPQRFPGAQISKVYHGRIQVTGNNQPEVVGQLLRWVDYRGRVLLRIPGSGDSELDVWMYQHFLEVRKIKCGTLIPNDKMPDHPTVLQLLRFALNLTQTPESELLVPLCVKVLKENLLTGPLIQAISSDAVYLEYSKLSIRQRAALLVATATLLTCSMRARAIRFASEPLINTLQSLLRFIESQDGCFLRSRGIIAAKAVVPADAKWHDWHEFLESTVLYVHWQRLVLHSSSHGGVPLPMEWYLPEVLEMVLVGDDDVEVSTQGIKIAARSVQTPEEKSVHSTTLVEDVEDGIYELMQKSETSVLALDVALQETQKIQKLFFPEAGSITKDFFQHTSFYVTEVAGHGPFVQLTKAGTERAAQRDVHNKRRSSSASELSVARLAAQYLKRFLGSGNLTATQLPPAATDEFCGLFICLSETCSNSEMAASILKRLANLPPRQLIRDMLPFNVVQLMQGVVSFQKAAGTGKKAFDHDSLMMLMNAASADIFDSESSLPAPLHVAADYLIEATRTPFFGLNWKDLPMLPVSASRRIIKELTPENADTCPACLSADYSTIQDFAKLCQQLANFYSHACSHLVLEHRQKVTEAFSLVASSCKQFCLDISAQSPSASKRLVTTFATLAKVDSSESRDLAAVAESGLGSLRPILARALVPKIKLKEQWDLGKCGAVATAYAAYGPSDDHSELFAQIAEAATRMGRKLARQNKLQEVSVSCFEILKAFADQGQLRQLQAFLKILKEGGLLGQKLKEVAHSSSAPWKPGENKALRQMEVVHVLAAFVCTEDPGADDFAFRFLEGKDIAVPAMIVMLDNLPRSKVKKLLLEKVLTATTVQVPSTRDLQRLVHACQDDADCKAQVQHFFSGKSLLDLVPTEHKDLHDLVNTLEQFLVPFTQMSVPRLESLCAGRLMQFLAKAGTTNSDEVVKAGLQFKVEALASMPSLVRSLTDALTEAETGWQTLVKRIEDSCSFKAEESHKDDCLDTWTQQIEEALVACGMPEMQWDQIEMNLMRSQDLQEVQAALGRNWLSIVLARSKHVLWKGGETVRIDVRASKPEEPAEPAPRERSRSRSKISRISEIQKPDVLEQQVPNTVPNTVPKGFTELPSGASPTLEATRRAAHRDAGGASRAASATGAPKSKAQKTSASPPSPPGAGSQGAQGAQGHEGPAVRDAQDAKLGRGQEDLREWLRSADPTGTGKLLKYGDKLTQELDDLMDLLEFVRDESWLAAPSTVDRIDPSFFQCIQCTQAGHKMLLAKAIMKLVAARS